MVPKDNAFTNTTVNDHIVARQSISTPVLNTQQVIVQQNIVLTNGATIESTGGESDLEKKGAVVFTTGNQTINGVKTFVAAPIFLSGIAINTLTLPNLSNQLILGTGNTITINAPTPASSRIYTIPDVGADALFVMTEGTQTINGFKTFSNQTTFQGDVDISSTLITSLASNQILFVNGANITRLNVNSTVPLRTYSLNNVGADAFFVMSEGTQTINGVKTFSSAPVFPALSIASLVLTNGTNQLTLGTGINAVTINGGTSAAARTYTIPDMGTTTNFVMTEGTQTINGAKTLSSATTFGTSILLPTTGGVPTGLTYYEEFSSSLDYTSTAFVGTLTVSYKITRIGPVVTFTSAGLSTLGNGASPGPIVSTNTIPTRFRPFQTVVCNGLGGLNNNALVIAAMQLSTLGVITFYNGVVGGNFTNAIQIQVFPLGISWGWLP